MGYRRLVLIVTTLLATVVRAEAQDGARGVNPRDLDSKFELFSEYRRLDGHIGLWTTAAKLDFKLTEKFAIAVETPFARFTSPFHDAAGLGDIAVRVRYVETFGRFSLLTGAEAVLPTAMDDALGTGKIQLNPTLGGVYMWTNQIFTAGVGKQIWSVGGESDRADLNQSQVRLINGYIAQTGWWAMFDNRLTHDWNAKTDVWDMQVEVGTMISPSQAVWIRPGTSLLDGTTNYSILVGYRSLF